jgi:hypothetical protein
MRRYDRETIIPALVFPIGESCRETAAVRCYQHESYDLPQMQLEPSMSDVFGHPYAEQTTDQFCDRGEETPEA